MAKEKNKYEKLMARKEEDRPPLFKELGEKVFPNAGECIVMSAKLLTRKGNTMEFKYVERLVRK
jgi:hypothetical protein